MLRFLGIGAQKAGTTWLYHQLRRHPRVRFPGGKEIHYWDARIHTESRDWYRALFDASPDLVEGDITPAYAILDPEVIRCVREQFPDLRIIFIMRNPIERAWSSALMALHRAEMEIDEASDNWFLDHFRSRGSLARGDYLQILENWRGVFGHERVLAVFFDRVQSEPLAVLRECSRFLGLGWLPGWTTEAVNQRIFEGPGVAIRSTLIPPLLDLYAAQIAALERYCDTDLTHWIETPGHRLSARPNA